MKFQLPFRSLCRSLLALFLVTSSCTLMESGRRSQRREIRDKSLIQSQEIVGLKNRIMVLPFLNNKPELPIEIQTQARQALLLNLNRTQQVVALGSEDLKVALDEYLKEDSYRLEELGKAVEKLGVPTLLEGKILDVKVHVKGDQVGVIRNIVREFEVVVQVRMIHTRTGREIFNTQKNLVLEEGDTQFLARTSQDQKYQWNWDFVAILVKDAFLEYVPQIVKSTKTLSWQGRVAAVQGDRVFLNVGQISGVKVGDLLKVSDTSEDIYDPETGLPIGKVPGRLKGTLEVVSFFGQDGSIAIIHSGSGFKENDRVELY